MSLSSREKRALESISGQLTGSDPELTYLMDTFTRLTSGEEMPVREQVRARRSARYRRWSRAGRAICPGSGGSRKRPRSTRAVLLILVAVCLTLIGMAVALAGGSGGQAPCKGPWIMGCTQPTQPVKNVPKRDVMPRGLAGPPSGEPELMTVAAVPWPRPP